MSGPEAALCRLAEVPDLEVSSGVLLAHYARFGIGGPAAIYAETPRVEALSEALRAARASGLPWTVIGDGTNLIVADEGYSGLVLRFTGDRIERGGHAITVEAGAELQALVDFANAHGLEGLETLAGIPGSVGGAIYGNAGAYGHSICERVRRTWLSDAGQVRCLENSGCEFSYRESIFKRRKEWVIISAELAMTPADPAELRRRSEEIVAIRNQKYPPAMKCAGSIFKNLLYNELPSEAARAVPPEIIREGKVPAAWFLDQAGVKGMHRGDIHVATHHANLIYNAGAGTARDLCALVAELKRRVWDRFGLELEEEVQYLGFEESGVRSQNVRKNSGTRLRSGESR